MPASPDGRISRTAVEADVALRDDTEPARPDGPTVSDAAPRSASATSTGLGRRRRRSPLPPVRGRRVTRIVRRVQLWSVFKVALLGGLAFYVICLIAVAILWSLATSTGQVHHVEKFMRDVGFEDWRFDGAQLFRATALIGAVLTLASSVLLTLAAALVNLISELTGGLRFTVIEVEHGHPSDHH